MAKHLLTVPEEFILLILNEQTGYFHQIPGWTLNCAIIGAVLAELAMRSSIDTDETSLLLLDSTKTGKPALDLCLGKIASHPNREETGFWIEQLAVHSQEVIDTTIRELIELEILTRHDGEFYTTNKCDWHADLEQYPRSENVGNYTKSRISGTIFSDVLPEPRDSILIGLLKACDITRFLFELNDDVTERIDFICELELIARVISNSVQKTAISPSFKRPSITKPIPKVSIKSLVSNKHLWDGNLPALFGSLSEQYGPVFQISAPLQKPRTFLAGPGINDWARRNSRSFLTSGLYFRDMEGVCGASNLLPSLDGADHFRLRKLMGNTYSKKRFHERLGDMSRLCRQFMVSQDWKAGTEIHLQQVTRSMTSLQMFNVLFSVDAQDLFDDLAKWNERAILCYVADFLPRFLVHTPAMKRRLRLYDELMRRIEENHLPLQRAGRVQELADDLIALHNLDPQFIPEQNLMFMLAVTPVFQSIYLGDMLGFTLFEMARRPDMSQRIRDEANGLFDDGESDGVEFSPEKFDVTRRFIMECLRLYPIISVNLRNVANSCVVENYALPLRERLYIVQSASHYMSDCFPEPFKFDIDRYLPPRKEHHGPGYAPFGLDTHTCAGQAWFNLQLALNVLLVAYHFEFAPLPEGHKLKISPFPALSVSERTRIRIAKQLHELPS